MEHVRDLAALHLEGCTLAIGSFDGVHIGHQALVRNLVASARQAHLPSVVLTFYPHPSAVLRGRKPAFYLTTPDEKAALLGGLGVNYVVTQTFDRELAAVTADAFLDRTQTHLALRDLWVGEGFALGHRRQGNVPFLERAGVARGFRLHILPSVLVGGEVVSSTQVREALRSGDVARAASYLGRPFVVPGKVIKGSGRGRIMNMPTANLSIWDERACPGPGVYACLANIEGSLWMAVTNVGVRPTFGGDGRVPVVETHLLDFEGDLYGQEIRLIFIERLRDEMRFSGPEALLEQIRRDILRARALLDGRKEGAND